MRPTLSSCAIRLAFRQRIDLALVLCLLTLLSLTGCADHPAFNGIDPTPAVQIPAAPNAVTLTAADGQITIAWSPTNGATSYNVYWSNTSGVAPTNGTKVGSLSSSPYAHTSLTNGLYYYYVVTAVNSAGESAPSSQASAMPLPAGAVVIPLTPGTATSGTLNSGATPSFTFSFDGKEVTTSGSAIVNPEPQSALPVPFARQPQSGARAVQRGQATSPPSDTTCPFLGAFRMTVTPTTITAYLTPALLNGNVDPTIAGGTTLNLAMLQNGAWVYVATAVVGTNGAYVQNLPSVALPGILGPGHYVLCQPKSGGTTVSNLGIALIADDSNGNGQAADTVQVVHLYDSKGNPLATPTVDYLNYPNAGDLDGQAMTPDGSQGILVDGGNTLRFFSKVQTGTPVADTYTLPIPYSAGGDGDSVAIMPEGDEAVVSADDSSNLLLVSGILSGTAVAADLITIPANRDSVVISADGKVMLARGYSGLSVFAVTPITSKPGSLGGTVAHSYNYVTDLGTLGSDGDYDGRGGMAVSPVDSSRAVLISPYHMQITLVNGLPNTPVAGSPLDLSAAGNVYSVSVTPDGKSAVVGGTKGLLLISGVDTGTLAIVGSVYAPTYTGTSGSVNMGTVRTLGVTLDGKYVVVCDYDNSALLVIPITSTGFSAPVGLLNNFAVPYNDQMLIH